MNIIRVTSGLGNQMFQYAFFKAVKHRNPNTKMDVSEFKYRRHHQGYELEKLFCIEPVYASAKESNRLVDLSKDFFSSIRRNMGIKFRTKGILIDEREIGTFFHPELLSEDMDDCYFLGFWQTEKYFKDIENEIRADFRFKKSLDIANQEIAEKIKCCKSASIHVRRGDYLNKRRLETAGSICSLAYYRRAISVIRNRVTDIRFFIFSDEPEWVKNNLMVKNASYININQGVDSYKDMQLMSLCDHNIIANSSFSWWGAWLNANVEKMVIAPEIWMKNETMPDIVPENWTRISTT